MFRSPSLLCLSRDVTARLDWARLGRCQCPRRTWFTLCVLRSLSGDTPTPLPDHRTSLLRGRAGGGERTQRNTAEWDSLLTCVSVCHNSADSDGARRFFRGPEPSVGTWREPEASEERAGGREGEPTLGRPQPGDHLISSPLITRVRFNLLIPPFLFSCWLPLFDDKAGWPLGMRCQRSHRHSPSQSPISRNWFALYNREDHVPPGGC